MKEQSPFFTVIGDRTNEDGRLYDCHGTSDDVCIDGYCY